MLSQRAYKILDTVFWLGQVSCASSLFLNKSSFQLQMHSGINGHWKVKLAYSLHLCYLICVIEILRRMFWDNKIMQFHLTVAFFLCLILVTIFISLPRFNVSDAIRGTNMVFQHLQQLHGKMI